MPYNNDFYVTLYRDIDELKNLHKHGSHTVVVWGTGAYGSQVCMTLEAFGIPVACFGDNDKARAGTYIYGKEIIGQESLVDIQHPFIVIGSMFVREIYEQLRALGISEVHAIIECLKYPHADHIEERGALAEYFAGYEKNISERVLIEVNDFIGDVIIKSGVFRALIDKYGYENVYFFCDDIYDGGIADILRLFSNNIIMVDRRAFFEDKAYRLEALTALNSKYFKASISICGLEHHSGRRFLNFLNFNVRRIEINRYIYSNTYMLGQDVRFARNLLGYDFTDDWQLQPKGRINDAVKQIDMKHSVPAKFVAVGVGAKNVLRTYSARKYAVVADYLIGEGYYLAVLGQGADDEAYLAAMLEYITIDKSKVISFINRLTITESFYVLYKSCFFVGVESGMWNASFVLDKPSVVIYGGGDYGGFKHDDKKIVYVTVADHSCFNCRWRCANMAQGGKAKCVDGIEPRQIVGAIERLTKNTLGSNIKNEHRAV